MHVPVCQDSDRQEHDAPQWYYAPLIQKGLVTLAARVVDPLSDTHHVTQAY